MDRCHNDSVYTSTAAIGKKACLQINFHSSICSPNHSLFYTHRLSPYTFSNILYAFLECRNPFRFPPCGFLMLVYHTLERFALTKRPALDQCYLIKVNVKILSLEKFVDRSVTKKRWNFFHLSNSFIKNLF